MLPVTKAAVIGALYLMWRGNPDMPLGKLLETFAGAEGFEIGDLPDSEWPMRQWDFCPWCGSSDLEACMDAEREDSCFRQLWE